MTHFCPDCGLPTTDDPDLAYPYLCECDDGQDAQDAYREWDWADGVSA